MAIPKKFTVKEVIESNQAAYDDQLISYIGGYEFALIKDEDNGCWHIQVRLDGEGYLYDGYWDESENKTLEEAVKEAFHGAEI